MQKSNIFTEAELQALQDRRKGKKADPTGIYNARVKPKLLELLDWFKIRKEIQKLVSPSKRKQEGGRRASSQL